MFDPLFLDELSRDCCGELVTRRGERCLPGVTGSCSCLVAQFRVRLFATLWLGLPYAPCLSDGLHSHTCALVSRRRM